jgi:hypothetical protein
MPSNIVKSFSEKTGKTEKEVERLWNRAKEAVKNEYKDIEVESEQYYRLVTGVLKKMLKMESTITTNSANVGDGQSGQFKKRMFLMTRKNKV